MTYQLMTETPLMSDSSPFRVASIPAGNHLKTVGKKLF